MHFTHHKGLLKILRQTGDAVGQGKTQVGSITVDLALGLLPVTIFLKLAVDKALAVIGLGGDEALVTPGLAAEVIENLVMQDARQPRELGGLPRKCLLIGQRRGEGFLHQILRGLCITHPADGKTPQRIAILLKPLGWAGAGGAGVKSGGRGDVRLVRRGGHSLIL